jgi:RND family efflux transporter MFP subunit
MSNLIKGLLTMGVLFVAAVMAYGIVITAPTPAQIEPDEVATAIRTQLVEKQQVRLMVRSQGNVEPLTESDLIPEVSGKVKWISPKLVAGGYFEADEVLLQIDDRDYRSLVLRADAALARAKAEDEHARFEYQRLEELVKKKLTSQSTLEGALRSQRIAAATLTEAEVALNQAKRDLQRTAIHAPYAGLVRSKKVDQGQFVSRGVSIASVYSATTVEVRIPLADSQLAYLDLALGQRGAIEPGAQANVTLSTNYGGQYYEWPGKLVRTEAEIDARSRMVNAVVRVNNDPASGQPPLPIGLFVNAEIEGRLVDNVVVLPRAAIRNQHQVLVIDGDNRLRYRDVELLRFDRDEVYISGGLEAGEAINLSPIQTVIDGMRVKTVPNNA